RQGGPLSGDLRHGRPERPARPRLTPSRRAIAQGRRQLESTALLLFHLLRRAGHVPARQQLLERLSSTAAQDALRPPASERLMDPQRQFWSVVRNRDECARLDGRIPLLADLSAA